MFPRCWTCSRAWLLDGPWPTVWEASWCCRRCAWPTRSAARGKSFNIPITEYTAVAFGKRRTQLGIQMSMGTVGDCFDNAMMESFFSSLEAEVLDRNRSQRAMKPVERSSAGWRGGIMFGEGIRVLAIYRRWSLKSVSHRFGVVLLPHPRADGRRLGLQEQVIVLGHERNALNVPCRQTRARPERTRARKPREWVPRAAM
jgi:hypothetical protein